VGLEKRATMDEERTSYPYQRYTITTFQDEGVWWARARGGGEGCRGRSAGPGRSLEEPGGGEIRRPSVLRQQEGGVVARPGQTWRRR